MGVCYIVSEELETGHTETDIIITSHLSVELKMLHIQGFL